MALHLVTGYAGQEHITSADQGTYNIATFGNGQFVLDRGQKFKHTVLTNNSIKIADGEAMMQGRYIKMPVGSTETLSIDSGTQGKKRVDLIVIRYSKDTSTSVESASLVVIKGYETTGDPTTPAYTTGSITDGDDVTADMPLYKVLIDGINISTITTMFYVKTSMVDYMDNYQTPVASSNTLGVIKVGSDFNMINGVMSLKMSSETHPVYVGKDINIPTGFSIQTISFNRSDFYSTFGNLSYYQAEVMNIDKKSTILDFVPASELNDNGSYINIKVAVYNSTSSTFSLTVHHDLRLTIRKIGV